METPEIILKLCDTFALHKEHYKSGGYNETELRREFLDPFFKALGWDVDNEQGYADAYKDVIHEDAIKVGGYTKAPDYCFRIGGTRKFFVEAKKPSVDIHEGIAPAYQLRRYGWSGKLPLCILSDFEEFAVYDTRIKPLKSDKPAKARTLYVSYDQYAEKWDEIASIFSREAILKGSFDKYADTSKRKRGTGTVDAAFLAEIERWRDLLARNLALRNPSLSVRDLNFAVQKTIDRLIFLRICEDRGTEDYGRLQALQNGERTYSRLMQLFHQADNRYNSGLFHFDNGEKGRADSPDTLTPDLKIDDKALKDILKNLYYPDSPYEFSVLPSDILGQVYEQFLGKTIRLTSGHQARIEEKPEVRKAGGVYYTPSYIVDYIVKNTLGRQLDGDNPEKPKPISVSKAAELKVLDPACGSGSFLIVAYQYLLDWHLRQYTTDIATGEPDAARIKRHAGGKHPKIYQASGGNWKLTTDERKRILLNNIHGVDIDSQAVEVTKLSLLLKVLEGEKRQQLQRDFIKERQRILPDLGDNIKCGNSLIGPDFYDNEQMLLLDDDTQYRINVFDWDAAFPEIMQRGGFDCVIGNPPYVRQESLKESKAYLSGAYESASGTADLYVYFLEKAIRLLCEGGYASYIVSSSFLKTTFAKPLRAVLKRNTAVLQLTDFGGLPVFQSAKDTYVCIPLFRNAPQPDTITVRKVNTLEPAECAEQLEVSGFSIPHARFSEKEWTLRSDVEDRLFERLVSDFLALGEAVKDFNRGVTTGLNRAFAISTEVRDQIIAQDSMSGEVIYPLRGGMDCRRYFIRPTDQWLIFTRRGIDIGKYPAIKNHLIQFKADLMPKKSSRDARGRKPGRYAWYEIQDDVAYWEIFTRPKIVFPDICKHPRFSIDDTGIFLANTAYAIDSNDRYLLGFLNSRLFWWLIAQISIPFGVRAGEFRYRLIYQYMKQVPIRPINFDNPDDVAMHDKMVVLVERMLELNRKKAAEKNPGILQQLETQITATDRQIDQLVYKLYDLNDEEIALVEGRKREEGEG